MAAGGMDLCAITASCSFALPSFATASGGARASDRAACCSWGAPWGRGARVEVWRPWGVGGVVPMATEGVGLCAFSASCSFALLSFARASGGERASDRAACCSWGVPWSRDARVEVIWARDEVLCGKARFAGDFSTVYSPEAPLCPPLCHTPATTPVPWPRRCLVVALWWPGRALGLRCGLLKAKNTRFGGISMFFLKNGLLKALFFEI